MNTRTPPLHRGPHHVTGVALLLLFAAPTWGQLNISVDVTPLGGGVFHYDYVVTNTTPPDVVLLTIDVPPGPTTIDNLVAPAGFLANFEPAFGLLDFIGDEQSFVSGVPVSGFAFDSPVGPGEANYFALNVDGAFLFGRTTAPAPEPTVAFLVGAALAALVKGRRRASGRGAMLPRRGPSHPFHPF